MGRGGGSRGGGGGGARGGASSRPSSTSSSSHSTPATSTPKTTTTPTKPTTPPATQTRPASTTPAQPHATHARTQTQPHAQQQRSSAGSFMRSAMIGLGVGMLTSLGLNALFGLGREYGRPLDRTDVIASGVGAAAGLGTATLVKNRALFRKQPMLPPTHPNYLDPIFRPRFQMPKRYILWSVLGGLGGIMVNSMRIESNRVDEIQPPVAGVEGTNKWGDEAQTTTV